MVWLPGWTTALDMELFVIEGIKQLIEKTASCSLMFVSIVIYTTLYIGLLCRSGIFHAAG